VVVVVVGSTEGRVVWNLFFFNVEVIVIVIIIRDQDKVNEGNV